MSRTWRGLPAADLVLALAFLAAGVALLGWHPLPEEVVEGPVALNVLAVAAASLPLAARRVAPLPVALVVIGSLGLRALLGPPLEMYPPILASLVAGYSLGAYGTLRAAAVALPVAVTSLVVAAENGTGGDATPDPVAALVLLTVVWAVGRTAHVRHAQASAQLRRAEKLDAEREREAQEAVTAERRRIARELHDSVSHSLAVIRMQAGGAQAAQASRPEAVSSSLEAIERIARTGLTEMRALLELLDDDGEAADRAPLPGLDSLEELLAGAAAAGMRAELRIHGELSVVPATVGLCAYRIVQEALTNLAKHAADARVRIEVTDSPGCLEVRVTDDGDAVPSSGGAGRGLAGLRERVALLGGEFEAGPVEGGFGLRARLPWDAAA
jgi:signal transduction histidine kinase